MCGACCLNSAQVNEVESGVAFIDHHAQFHLQICKPDTDLLQATTMPDLVKGRQNLKIDVSERTGQLKALVKENFDRFISCKNTIDDIHKRLRKSEAHDNLSASGSSTSDMVIAIAEVFHSFWPPSCPLECCCHFAAR